MESEPDESTEEDGEEGEEGDDPYGADDNEAKNLDREPESLLASEKENLVDHDTTGLKMEDLALDSLQPSRSSPQSRHGLPHQEDDRGARIKEIVSNDIAKRKAQELRKFHSRRSTRNAGRPQGSKAKQDRTVLALNY